MQKHTFLMPNRLSLFSHHCTLNNYTLITKICKKIIFSMECKTSVHL